jgi:hypothetical protein
VSPQHLHCSHHGRRCWNWIGQVLVAAGRRPKATRGRAQTIDDKQTPTTNTPETRTSDCPPCKVYLHIILEHSLPPLHPLSTSTSAKKIERVPNTKGSSTLRIISVCSIKKTTENSDVELVTAAEKVDVVMFLQGGTAARLL